MRGVTIVNANVNVNNSLAMSIQDFDDSGSDLCPKLESGARAADSPQCMGAASWRCEPPRPPRQQELPGAEACCDFVVSEALHPARARATMDHGVTDGYFCAHDRRRDPGRYQLVYHHKQGL